ncbi:hypothetical protein JYT24_00550 [Parvibaculum lavamentivorans]|nr:hypothetical protein [Parvibaculum lavamentivorans]
MQSKDFLLAATKAAILNVVRATWHHAASLIVLFVLFINNTDKLFVGYDGAFYRYKFLHWLEQGFPRSYLTSDLYQGFGDLEFPLNFWFSLPSLLTRASYALGMTELLYYYFTTLVIFSLMVVLFRGAGFRPLISSILSVAFVGLILGYFGSFSIYPIYSITPWSMEAMILTSAMAALFVPIFSLRISPTKRAWSMLGFFSLATIAALLLPIAMVTVIPFVGIVFLVFTVARARTLWKTTPKSIILFAILGLTYSSIFGPFLAGVLLNTASSVFPGELVAPRDHTIFISTLTMGLQMLQSNSKDLNVAFYILSAIGSVLATVTLKDNRRFLFASVALSLLFLNIIGVYSVLSPNFSGVSPLYLEWKFWPLMFVAASVGVREAIHRITLASAPWIRSYPPLQRIKDKIQGQSNVVTDCSYPSHALALCLVLLVTFVVAWPSLQQENFPSSDMAQKPEIVSSLASAIGVSDGESLKGYVLNIAGARVRDSDGLLFWYNVSGVDVQFLTELGNELRTFGMWRQTIPTAVQYNQTMSPLFYYVATRAFSVPGDQRIRSLLMLSQVDSKWLRIMGIRYIISDEPVDMPGLIETKVHPVAAAPNHPLIVYEVEGWVPFNVMSQIPQTDLVAEMASPEYIQRTSAIPDSLSVDVHENSITVTNQSSTRANISVPVIYSHCFTILHKSLDRDVELFPAYGATLGVSLPEFSTVELQYRNGPFDNPWCRLRDWQHAQKIFPTEEEWQARERHRESH